MATEVSGEDVGTQVPGGTWGRRSLGSTQGRRSPAPRHTTKRPVRRPAFPFVIRVGDIRRRVVSYGFKGQPAWRYDCRLQRAQYLLLQRLRFSVNQTPHVSSRVSLSQSHFATPLKHSPPMMSAR
jgi:hypothetical protein